MKKLSVANHSYSLDLAGFGQIERSRPKVWLIYGLTSTLWTRFLLKALEPFIKTFNIELVAVDRFGIDSKFVAEARAAFEQSGLRFRKSNWYAKADLTDFQTHAASCREGFILIDGQRIPVDMVICTTTPNFNLSILELWLAQGVKVYIDKPLGMLETRELFRIGELKTFYRDQFHCGDFFLTSPATDFLLRHRSILFGHKSRIIEATGVCYEPWPAKSEANEAGNRTWVVNPAICRGLGGHDCAFHGLSLVLFLLGYLDYEVGRLAQCDEAISGTYLDNDVPVFPDFEIGHYSRRSVANLPVHAYGGKALGKEAYYGSQFLLMDGTKVNVMVGTQRFDAHVAIEKADVIEVNQLQGCGLGYSEIGRDLVIATYNDYDEGLNAHQARVFRAMSSTAWSLAGAYNLHEKQGSQFVHYNIGNHLPGAPARVPLIMPPGLLPAVDVPSKF